jgi:hypothetical protein
MTVVLILSLSVSAGAGMLATQPRETVSLWNADENWRSPGGYTLDTENQAEGEGCVSINFKAGTRVASTSFDAVDATGMLALEFDMYISDLAILDMLKKTQGNVEICSGGDAYHGHMECYLKDIATALDKGCPKTGWNHVIVFLKDMKDRSGEFDVGPFDISHIDYLRIYWMDVTDCGEDWILKFDNFVLTDRQAAPNPHTPTEWEYDENKHWRYCTECDKKIDEHAHSPFYWTNSPNYSSDSNLCEDGFTCYDCGQECGPFAHEFTIQDRLVKKATCTQGDMYDCRCARCGEKSEEPIEVGTGTGHRSLAAYKTCGAEGHATKCENCGERVSEVAPHHLSEWVIEKEATETEDGLRHRECDLCVYVEDEVIPKTGPLACGNELGKTGCSGVMGGVPLLIVIGLAVLAMKKKK